ncbi:hypothetical protein DRN74_04635 [Candidatus Micrarchaeota archaeon]|nr:MAG: hypothetical protein DRN74_04635 [Candidatus Micrarchaeota archaeon]
MSWYLYSLTFRVKSPLHVGFHKVMRLFQTRVYVPARPFWGALTAKLTRSLKSSNYREVGEFLKKVMRFGYLYLSDGNNLFILKYTDDVLKFGNLPQIEFEKRFISSLTSTSIEPYSFTAEEGMLHDVEFISPYEIHKENEESKPVFLKGLLWISERSEEKLAVQTNENNFSITDGKNDVKFSDLADTLQIGGERKYGFGQLRLDKKNGIRKVDTQDLGALGFNGIWKDDKGEIILELKKNEFIWSHVKYDSDLKIKGSIEPVVGRDWSDKGAGRELRFHGLCWVPGSILMENKTFKITEEFGIWEVI